MTRLISSLISVVALLAMAIAVSPAAAQPAPSSGDYQSPNAFVAAVDPGSTSVNATLGTSSSDPGSTSVNATLGGGSSNGSAPISGAHEPESTLVAVPSVAPATSDSDGFDWALALIIAGGGCALLALGLAGARTAARHRRTAAA